MSSRERIQKALDSLLYLPHLQAQHSDEQLLPVASAEAPAGGKGRPWDRGDLFRRLATFRSGTWFCKPAAISPVECARRGWTNTALDLLTCEFCKAKISCPIPADLLPEEAQQAGQRYAAKLSDAHDAACPWRNSASSPSLLQFPPLTAEAVRRDFDARCSALQRLACLPPVAAEPYQALAAGASKQGLDQLLLTGSYTSPVSSSAVPPAAAGVAASLGEGVAALGSPPFEARARLLALCGWDVRLMTAAPPSHGTQQAAQQQQELPSLVGPESAALHCGLCNAKAGLWTFFPQCKPRVLAPPRRRGAGGVTSPTAAVSRVAVTRNVAADIGTTIAGGALQAAAGAAAAAPFGAGSQQPVFGDGSARQQPAAQAPAAQAAPFGSSTRQAGVPVFGFAALQASQPAAAAGGQAGGEAVAGAAQKRKQPDFSWEAVMADINAKAAAEKRSKAAAAAGSSASNGSVAALAAPAAAGPSSAAGSKPGGAQQVAAAAAIAANYRGLAVAALDPLTLHRPFCPWVNCTQAGEKEGRCGWRWCLQQLTAQSVPSSDDLSAAEDGDGGSSKVWDPAKLLRNVLQQVGVQK